MKVISNKKLTEIETEIVDFNLTDRAYLIPPCDVVVYGPNKIEEMFPNNPHSMKNGAGKLIVLSSWEGGFNPIPKQEKLSSCLEIPVVVLSQNELASHLCENVGYINLCWEQEGWAWWQFSEKINFECSKYINYTHPNFKPNPNPLYLYNFIVGAERESKVKLYNKLDQSGALNDQTAIWIATNRKNNLKHIPYKNVSIDQIISIPKAFIKNAKEYNQLEDNKKINELNVLYCVLNSRFSLVFETEMSDHTNRYTEKTMKPISAQQPFIIAGNYRCLKLLHNDGFKTFHPFIDETYDSEKNVDKRIDLIVTELKRLCSMSFDDWQKLIKSIEPTLKHNKNHLQNLRKKYKEVLAKAIFGT